jgi:hypothetical protein
MAKYLLVFHGGGMPETDEEQQRVMAAWTDWYGALGAAVADPGNPIGRTMTIASDGAVSEGGGANPASGYAVIESGSIDEAVAASKGCPILASGGSVEVAETFDVM